MDPKPDHLGPRYCAVFETKSVARAYHTRPPYPAEFFDILLTLQAAGPRSILDLGCGTGDVALGLVGRAERIDAVDPSQAMLRVARARRGGDHPSLRWICASAEAFELRGRYSLIVAAESLHWMDWESFSPSSRTRSAPARSWPSHSGARFRTCPGGRSSSRSWTDIRPTGSTVPTIWSPS